MLHLGVIKTISKAHNNALSDALLSQFLNVLLQLDGLRFRQSIAQCGIQVVWRHLQLELHFPLERGIASSHRYLGGAQFLHIICDHIRSSIWRHPLQLNGLTGQSFDFDICNSMCYVFISNLYML